MAELLALDLFKKKLVASSVTLHVGYDTETLYLNNFNGETVRDYYGREVPKPAHGSFSFGSETNSSKFIVKAFVKLLKNM